jgi:uncharacterized Tic20 family protein
MWAHLAGLAAFLAFTPIALVGFLSWLPALIIKQSRPQDEFVGRHSTEAMNFQLQWLILSLPVWLVSSILVWLTLGLALLIFIPIAVVLGVFFAVVIVRAAIAASQGRNYVYPLMLFRLIK